MSKTNNIKNCAILYILPVDMPKTIAGPKNLAGLTVELLIGKLIKINNAYKIEIIIGKACFKESFDLIYKNAYTRKKTKIISKATQLTKPNPFPENLSKDNKKALTFDVDAELFDQIKKTINEAMQDPINWAITFPQNSFKLHFLDNKKAKVIHGLKCEIEIFLNKLYIT